MRRRTTATEGPTSHEETSNVSGQATSPQDLQARTIDVRPLDSFTVRDGDRLTVMYQGAKLQIAPFSTVEIDGSIYSRTMKPGDDPVEEWDRIYEYLESKVLSRARVKLRMFAEELAEAKKLAGGR